MILLFTEIILVDWNIEGIPWMGRKKKEKDKSIFEYLTFVQNNKLYNWISGSFFQSFIE